MVNLSFFYLFISKKCRTFAHVIELERHIEILLLSNDCVIVPGLGGFMTHHVEAHFDERDYMFLPPLRTLGFNPQLNINDSLLALTAAPQKQSGADYRDRHREEHFVRQVQYARHRQRAESNVGETVADERETLENEGHA